MKRKQTPEYIERTRIAQSIEVYSRCAVVECVICGEEEDAADSTVAAFAAELHVAGWRWGISEQFQLAGVMCPACFAKPDAERGGD